MNSQAKMTPYPEYKATNLPWLPQIPAHWETIKVKYAFAERSEKGFPGEPLLAATQNYGVIPKSLYETRTVVAQKDLHLLKLVKVGDFVISLRSFQGGIEYAYYQGIISPAYTIMIPNNAYIISNYFKYLAKSKPFVKLLQTCVTGIREGQNIDYSTLKRNSIPIPSAAEQEQIVRYLDSMTAKINKLIRTKKKQIALLQEQKQAIINQAVTKGLNPNAEMKDSGIDWLGQIPAHWEISRCKYLLRETNFRSENGDEEHLSMSQKDGLIPDSQLNGHHLMSESYIGGKICKKNDLVLNRLKAHLGVFALAPQLGVVSPDYTILNINCKKVLPRYIEHVLKSNSCRSELRIRVRGIVEGFWRLYTDDLYDITLPLPNIEEQQRILNFIAHKTQGIDRCLSDYANNIDLLKEYLNSLIASVVTGQVDVRNIQVEDFDPADLISETDDDPPEDNDQPLEESEVE